MLCSRQFAIAWAISLILIYSTLCSAASTTQEHGALLASSTIKSKHSSLPSLEECSNWCGFSSGDANEETLHSRMCNRSATTLSSREPPTPEPLPTDDVESVKAIEEAVLEVLPSAQQNFALTRDGAKILAYNPNAKKVGAILDDDSDTYMRNECRDDKWVVLELSQVAKVSRIELIQHELYSSRIKEFEIRGRQSHPRTDNVETSKGLNSTSWKLLGKFTAEKAKGTQQFTVERPLWAHYLLIRFLTHYGSEPVCALNAFAVYGKSAAEELEDQLGEGLEIESSDASKDVAEEEGGGGGSGGDFQEQGAAAVLEGAAAGGGSSELEVGKGIEKGNTAEDRQQKEQNMEGGASKEAGGEKATAAAAKEDSFDNTKKEMIEKKEDASSTTNLERTAGDGTLLDIKTTASSAATAAAAAKETQQAADAAAAAAAAAVLPTDAATGATAEKTTPAGTDTPTSIVPPVPAFDNSSQIATNTTIEPPTATATPGGGSAAAAAASAVVLPTGNGDAAAGSAHTNGGIANNNNNNGVGLSLPFDVFEPLPVPKMKTGAGVYDVLIQEIRVTKAQQRVTAKALESLQRNLTAASIALSRMKTEYEISESDLRKKVDEMINGKLSQYEDEMIGLRYALKRAAKREHAALSLLAMLGGALVLSLQSVSVGKTWQKARTAVIVLALMNGAVGVALHWQSAGYLSAIDRLNTGTGLGYSFSGGSAATPATRVPSQSSSGNAPLPPS
jgi:hypothetical protein